MYLFCAFLAGLVFGLGLIVSGMASPAKVLGFLDLKRPLRVAIDASSGMAGKMAPAVFGNVPNLQIIPILFEIRFSASSCAFGSARCGGWGFVH